MAALYDVAVMSDDNFFLRFDVEMLTGADGHDRCTLEANGKVHPRGNSALAFDMVACNVVSDDKDAPANTGMRVLLLIVFFCFCFCFCFYFFTLQTARDPDIVVERR